MAQQVVEVDGIGPVTLSRRRGTRHLRISINARGGVRVGLPRWVPYRVGIEFAQAHRDWIKRKLADKPSILLHDGSQIGKAHRLRFKTSQLAQTDISTRIKHNKIEITSHLAFDDDRVQKKALSACERALKIEANTLLPQRLKTLSEKHHFSYSGLKVRKLTSRWGSCSSQGDITLSYLLIQLPWDLIDYVLLHELVHTKHMNHSPTYWSALEAVLPDAKQRRKQIKKLHPQLLAV